MIGSPGDHSYGCPICAVPVRIGITDESIIAPMSTPVEVVHLGNVLDAATCGMSNGSLDLSEESETLVGESVTLASSSAASSGPLAGSAASGSTGSLSLSDGLSTLADRVILASVGRGKIDCFPASLAQDLRQHDNLSLVVRIL